MVWNRNSAFLAHPPRLNAFTRFSVPDLDGLVGGGGDEAFGVAGPGDGEDAAFVFVGADLARELACFTVVEVNFTVCAYGDEGGSVRGKRHAVDEAVVVAAEGGIEFKRGAMVENEGGVVAASGCSSGYCGSVL